MPYLYVIVAIMLRLLPHPWNMTPIGAMFLFSGATFQRKSNSLFAPLLALILSDIAIVELMYDGRYAWFSPFTWLGFLAMGLLGWGLRSRFSALRLLAASLVGSLLFFLISNFGVWLEGTIYPLTWSGLAECYVAAIPFFRNSLFGDLLYSAAMFGSYRWLDASVPQLRPS